MKNFALLTAAALAFGSAHAAPKPGANLNVDFTTGAPAPDAKQHDWTLGPTGLRGWMFAEKFETAEARQIFVTRVDTNSPADGTFVVGDVILGVGGKQFAGDPRTAFGQAVTEAEAGDGKLRLLRWRAGRTELVSLSLAVLGSYGDTAPFACPKSAKIFDSGCAALHAKLKAMAPDKRGNPIVRSLNALALLASGKAEYMDVVREEAKWAAGFSTGKGGLPTWWYGYVTLFLAEYQLATGDAEVMPGLSRLALEVASGQSAVGSWGHGFAIEGGRLGGYGAMHQPGLPLTISMVLARKAGVKDAALDAAIVKGVRFIGFYIGKGSIPYGDHHPWIQGHDDNGKNGAGAVLFDLLDHARGAEFFSRMSTAAHGAERDTGHTGNFFNMLWAMPGVARSGPQATGAWMKEFGWYYDLARRWDGSFVYQGQPAAYEDNKHKDWDSSGAYLLAYAMPLKKIYLTGKKPSAAPMLSAVAARSVVEDGRGWSQGRRAFGYEARSVEQLFAGLTNWSPVVRERSAETLAKRAGDHVPRLLTLLGGKDANGRLGACSAFSELGNKASNAAPALIQTLQADDLWLRVQASRALANIGDRSSAPQLLKMLATKNSDDPRGMLQRYLTFSLFSGEDVRGMLARSLDGIDRRLLYPAVEAALKNEDGRSRGAVEVVYDRLTFDEIKPLLPAIHRAIVEPAPSGEMFADGIRINGLELFAKYRIAEGIPLCMQVVEHKRWGESRRIEQVLKILVSYGAAAKSQIPDLRKLEAELSAPRANGRDRLEDIRKAIATIEASTDHAPLRSLQELVKP